MQAIPDTAVFKFVKTEWNLPAMAFVVSEENPTIIFFCKPLSEAHFKRVSVRSSAVPK